MPPRTISQAEGVEAAHRREVLKGLMALPALAACGRGSESRAARGGRDGFPRTVAHALGETRIPTRPERVVAVSDGAELAALLALGVKPAGFGQRRDPLRPWLVEAGAEDRSIARYRYGDGPNLEQIAAWRPDLIVSQDTLIRSIYGQVSGIAPTLATSLSDWRLNFRRIAAGLGLEEAAKAKEAGIDAVALAAKARLAPYADRRATYIWVGSGKLYVYNSASLFGELATALGLPPVSSAAAGSAGVDQLSPEQAREIQADLLLVGPWADLSEFRTLLASGLFGHTAAARTGRVVELSEMDAFSITQATILSVPFGLRVIEREYLKAFGS